MRRFLRIALNIVTALSLLLAIATTVFWMRSRIINDDAWFYYSRTSATRTYSDTGILSQAGILEIYSWSRSIDTQEGFDNDDGLLSPRSYREGLNYRRYPVGSGGRGGSFWWRHGFRFEWPRWHATPQGYHLGRYTLAAFSAPHWFFFLLFTILPCLWLFRRLRSFLHRSRAGLCPICGYDLRASPDQCPECGAARQPTIAQGV